VIAEQARPRPGGRVGRSALGRGRPISRGLALAVVIALTVVFSLPTIWLLLTSFKTETEYGSYPIRILPAAPQLQNYVLAVTMFPFLRFFLNSVLLSGSYTVLTVLTSAAAGFGFSRHRGVAGRDFLFALVLATMMVPQLVTLVPQYVLFSELGLLNSYWPWILWGLHGSAFHIFLFRQFFSAIPRDLEDAAEVDGCGKFRIFWQIFLPNSLPAVTASAIFCFTWVWGDWLYPKLFLNDQITTLAVRLATSYVNPQNLPLYTVTMAGVVLYVLPMVLVFFLAQKYIIQGVVTTGLKG
jgi:ABC-type glycerol-3-phosphate transport system permease component